MTAEKADELFDKNADSDAPLAERMRPSSLEEFAGQEHLTGKGKILPRIARSGRLPSLILWGPPGSGKTTLARLLASFTDMEFLSFSAVLSGVKEVREVVKKAKGFRRLRGKGTALFVDEVHRFNKAQQDAFLPHVEDGTIALIGATTENPSFEVISPLLSRCQVIVLHKLDDEAIGLLIDRALADSERGLGKTGLKLHPDGRAVIVESAGGDARRALNCLETAASFAGNRKTISAAIAAEAAQAKTLRHDKTGEDHYNVVSAFIKSMRGTDPDAAVYWMTRMLEAGEDPRFIARRMIIFASEDVGNADPVALMVAVAAAQAVERVGLPECAINLSHAATCLASAPKSNASYLALKNARVEIKKSGALDVPVHLRNAPTALMKKMGYGKDYLYPHDYDDSRVDQTYLPERIKDKVFYRPTDHGREKTIAERLKKRGKK